MLIIKNNDYKRLVLLILVSVSYLLGIISIPIMLVELEQSLRQNEK